MSRKTNEIRLNQDGKLVIMQVSDPQDMVHVRKAMVQMLDNAYDKVKPDLVLFTGDNILGNHLLDARFGTRQVASGWQATYDRIEKSLAHILEPLEKRGIPFAMVYGNHDDCNCVTKQEHIEAYRKYSMCLPMNDSDRRVDCDTYNIPVLSNDGSKTVFNLWMLDCAWHDHQEDRGYAAIKKETVEWYKEKSAQLKEENGGKLVKSLLFQHIPLNQTLELLKECEATKRGAVKAYDSNKYYCLDTQKASGFLGEYFNGCDDEFGLFEAIKETGDVMAVVTGHDHCNNFVGEVDGIKFVATPAASFRCYGNDQRGVRVFVLDENKPDEFETYTLDYTDLCGDSLGANLRYIWDADDKILEKGILIAGSVCAAAVLTAKTVKALKKIFD